MDGRVVLLLNQNYEPLNVCSVRRAILLLLMGKVEILENGSGEIRTVSSIYPLPSVIRLVYLVRRPRPQRRLTHAEVFNRDKYTCQYCSRQTKDLTIDHIVPRYRGGEHTWENVVSACISCNRKKAGRTPSEAGMKLIGEPLPPPSSPFYIPYSCLQAHEEWGKFLTIWERGG